MILPKSVTKLLNDEEKNLKKVMNHINNEKRKVDDDINIFIQEIIRTLHGHRQELNKQFSDYGENYKHNYETLKKRVH